MKFTVEREHLLKPLQQVSGPLGGRPTLPILGNLLLQVADGALSLTGTDLKWRWWRAWRWFSRTKRAQRPFRHGNSLISAAACRKARRSRFSWKAIACWCVPPQPLLLSTLPAADFPNLDDWQSEVELPCRRRP